MHVKTQIQGKMAILNTHAHETSNAIDIRKEYRGRIKHIPYRKGRKDFVIWATSNNGQVSRAHDMDGK